MNQSNDMYKRLRKYTDLKYNRKTCKKIVLSIHNMNIFNMFLDENMLQMMNDASMNIDASMNDINTTDIYSRTMNRSMDESNEFMERYIQNAMQRYVLSNTLLENQDQPDILNVSLNDKNPYKQVISDKGKKLLYTSLYSADDMCSNNNCPISQEDFELGDEITILPCKHGFIKGTVEKWLETQCPECPICRYKFDSIEVKNEDENEDDNEDDNENIERNTHNSSINASRNILFNSLNSLENMIHPFGRNQVFNTVPHSYIESMYSQSEDMQLNQAIINSLNDSSSNQMS